MSGHPALWPPAAVCYLLRSPAVAAAELDLEQRALLAVVAGARSGVSRAEVQALLQGRFHLGEGALSVHPRRDGEFLLRFRDTADRTRVAAGNVSGRFRLLILPWSRLAGGEPVSARFHVHIEMVGIPDHAWDRASAETLLTPFCDIAELAPETADMSDMSTFCLSAWTLNPDTIPRLSKLLLPTPDAAYEDADPNMVTHFGRPLLRFPVSIHVSRSEDYRLPAAPSPAPDSGDDAQADHPSPPVPPPYPQRHDFPPHEGRGANRGDGATTARRRLPVSGLACLGPTLLRFPAGWDLPCSAACHSLPWATLMLYCFR